MAGSSKPSPLGLEPEVQDLDDGTHIRAFSPRPGSTIGTHVTSIASVHVIPGENVRTLKDEEIKELNSRWQDLARNSTVGEYLVGIWLDDYYDRIGSTTPKIVETTQTGFSYLFDISHERLIAAWGFIEGKNTLTNEIKVEWQDPKCRPKIS